MPPWCCCLLSSCVRLCRFAWLDLRCRDRCVLSLCRARTSASPFPRKNASIEEPCLLRKSAEGDAAVFAAPCVFTCFDFSQVLVSWIFIATHAHEDVASPPVPGKFGRLRRRTRSFAVLAFCSLAFSSFASVGPCLGLNRLPTFVGIAFGCTSLTFRRHSLILILLIYPVSLPLVVYPHCVRLQATFRPTILSGQVHHAEVMACGSASRWTASLPQHKNTTNKVSQNCT